MADKYRVVEHESGIAEHMVRMGMRIDDITDGQRRGLPDSSTERLSNGESTTGIDNRDTSCANDKTDVGNGTAIFRRCVFMYPFMNEHARCNFTDRKWCRLYSRSAHWTQDKQERAPARRGYVTRYKAP
jgi:hypothetical protein